MLPILYLVVATVGGALFSHFLFARYASAFYRDSHVVVLLGVGLVLLVAGSALLADSCFDWTNAPLWVQAGIGLGLLAFAAREWLRVRQLRDSTSIKLTRSIWQQRLRARRNRGYYLAICFAVVVNGFF